MTDNASVLGSLHAIADEGVVRMEDRFDTGIDDLWAWEERGMPVKLLQAYGAGIQIHVEHLADYIDGRELRDVETRWNELFPAYEAVGVS